MPAIPRSGEFDSTFAILKREGYDYIRRTCERVSSDIFETRFMLKKAVCFRGEEAARLFYDNSLFERRGTIPLRIQRTLLGRGGVHGLDGHVHARRKRMFMSLMTSESLDRLERLNREHWEKRISDWVNRRKVSLFKEAREILCKSICEWAGIPLDGCEVAGRAADLGSMIAAFGATGVRHGRGRRARRRTENWLRCLIRDVRAGRQSASFGSAVHVAAFHRDIRGRLLDEQVAAVELLNLVRPTVAVAYLVTFAGVALHHNPAWREKLRVDQEAHAGDFVHEVRRFYPFAPFVGARARHTFRWKGFRIPRGRLVILDLFGTNRDPRIWDDADAFRPERFAGWNHGASNFIPQGGGNHFAGHRCAGEWMTIRLLRIAVECLTSAVAYDVPSQDLGFPMNRLPTLPASGFVIDRIRRINSMTSCRLSA